MPSQKCECECLRYLRCSEPNQGWLCTCQARVLPTIVQHLSLNISVLTNNNAPLLGKIIKSFGCIIACMLKVTELMFMCACFSMNAYVSEDVYAHWWGGQGSTLGIFLPHSVLHLFKQIFTLKPGAHELVGPAGKQASGMLLSLHPPVCLTALLGL